MIKPLILDFGTVSFRIGRAGEKFPSFSAPPVFGKPSLKGQDTDINDVSGDFGQFWLGYSTFPLNPREKHDGTIPVPALLYGENGFEVDQEILSKFLESCTGPRGIDEGLQDSSVLVSEPNKQNENFRHVFAELLSETYRVDKFYLCKRAVLSCYASARTSGVVVDVGGSCSNISPVSEGYILQECVREEPMGGSLIDRVFLSYLSHIGIKLRPSFEYYKVQSSDTSNSLFSTENSSKSPRYINSHQKTNHTIGLRKLPFVHAKYYQWCSLYAASRLKETCIVINEDLGLASTEASESLFSLPDGSSLDAEKSKSLCGIYCCCLFKEYRYLKDPKEFTEFAKLDLPSSGLCVLSRSLTNTNDSITLESILSKSRGLSDLLWDSWRNLDTWDAGTVSPETRSCIIMSGGATTHPAVLPLLKRGFSKHSGINVDSDIESYILDPSQAGKQPCFISIGGREQQYSSFIGGSILASLGSFGGFCISREDLTEHGIERMMQRRCP